MLLSATRRSALAVVAGGLIGVAGEVSAAESGVSGVVTISSSRPGPAIAGEPNSKPFAGAEVHLRDVNGSIVAHTKADSNGNFRILAPTGQYQVYVGTAGGPFPRCRTETARVPEGQLTHIDIGCDSGLR